MMGTLGLNLVAWVALHVQRPLAAKRLVDRAGRLLPRLSGAAEAREVAGRIGRFGTCLSRALAISARLPGAAVVIGVQPMESAVASIHAHAWVELDGKALRATDVVGSEIARLDQHPWH